MAFTTSRRSLLAASLGLAARPLAAQSVPPATYFAAARADAGWAEAVLIVRSLQRTSAWLEEVAGWTVRDRSRTRPELLRLWELPQGAEGREWLMGNPGDASGLVRLVELEGAGPQQEIRASGMPWDTGGVFSLMTRSRALDAAFARHQAMGFSAFNDPQDFDFGGVVLRNIVLRGPDGVNLAIYERVSPRLTGWTTIRKLSAPFNAMQMVRDVGAARRFYEGLFGYAPVAAGRFLDPAPAPNNFALPQNLATTSPRDYAIMAVGGSEIGRVEPMHFEGLMGRDLAGGARPPNYGVAVLRFPTARLAATLNRARALGFAPSPVIETMLPPWGRVRLAQLTSPDGVIAELMETVAA
jgi:catechol 2,3-dioxygenase-like lactoylglutathione lyase family enzyme